MPDIIMCMPLNLSMARFMKGFKTSFQELTDLVCIILRLFFQAHRKHENSSIIKFCIISFSVPTSCNVSLIRDMSQA